MTRNAWLPAVILNIALIFMRVSSSPAMPGDIHTVAGGGNGDGGPAILAPIANPSDVAVDALGNTYIAIAGRIKKVDATTGTITTVAGNGVAGYSGDGGPAILASMSSPLGLAVDVGGNIYIADWGNNRIRKVDTTTGVITSVAGNGSMTYSGDNGPAISAGIPTPHGVAVDATGNIFIADWSHRIRKIDAVSGVVTTIAGNGTAGYSGDNGLASSASLNLPYDVAVDNSGNVYIADTNNLRVRKVDSVTGIISTVAGNGTISFFQDNIPATSATLRPYAITVDNAGNIYISTDIHRVRKVEATTGLITTAAGNGVYGYSGDNVLATATSLNRPLGITVDYSGNLYIADCYNNRIRLVDGETHIITTIAGNGTYSYLGDNGPAISASLGGPSGVAIDQANNIYIADVNNDRIRKIDAVSGVITTIAGNGTRGYSGDNGPATSASLQAPSGVAIDVSGNIYIADTYNYCIRKVDASTGFITTVAGGGGGDCYSGDNGPATSANLCRPYGVNIDVSGNLYIADTWNHRIRKVDAVTGIITTVAGNGIGGYSGDNGAATSASLFYPNGVVVDASENIYIADTDNNSIRKVDGKTGIITSIVWGYFFIGDPRGISMDSLGNLLVSDSGYHLVRKIDLATGIITTVAGNGTQGNAGDEGPALLAALNYPSGIATDSAGNIYIADRDNNRIRKVDQLDDVPDAFTFSAQTGVALGAVITSNVITVTGINAPSPISVSGGEYEINSSGLWSSLPGTVSNGDTVRVRQISSSGYGTTTGAILTIGSVSAAFTVKTIAPPPATGATLTVSPASPQSTGQSIVFTAGGIGGLGSYEYKFVLQNSGGTSTVQSYSAANSWAWNTSGYASGDYTVIVYVRSAGSSAEYEATKDLSYTLVPGVTGATLTANLSSPQLAGTVITLTAGGIGGTGNYEYKFMLQSGTNTTTVSDYSPTNTWVWNTNAYAPGQYIVIVYVRNAGSSMVYEAQKSLSYTIAVKQVLGIMRTIAGGGIGDGGQAVTAIVQNPYSVALDAVGNIYIADWNNHKIRKVDVSTGIITTVAGSGINGFAGDNGPATLANLNWPRGVAIDVMGNIYIADTSNQRIRKVDVTTGLISTVAGNGSQGYSGDNGLATSAMLSSPFSIALDAVGNMYIADRDNHRIRKVAVATGIITTVVGSGTQGYAGDNGSATSARISLPAGVAMDTSGNIYIADTGNQRIRKVDSVTGVITTIAGNGINNCTGDNGPATSASLNGPSSVTVDNAGNVYIAVSSCNVIRKVDVTSGIITTVAGGSYTLGDNGPATLANLASPSSIFVDTAGDLYIADQGNNRIRKVDSATNIITTVAGNGSTSGYSGDNILATSGTLNRPQDVAADALGDVYIADSNNARIRKVDAVTGIISTVAGNGIAGYSGDNGPATSASISIMSGVAVDRFSNIYIADTYNSRIRKVTGTTGVITTVAGDGTPGYSGDNGLAAEARLNNPGGVAVDNDGNIYIADTNNNRLRKIDGTTGIIRTIAGNGTSGYSGDNGPATSASVAASGVAVDFLGNVYIVGQMRVRKVDSVTGVITTTAGNGTFGYSGDYGPATEASLNFPYQIAVDAAGNIYIADQGNNRVRLVNSATGIITTIAGNGGAGYSGDNGPATSAKLFRPYGVAIDATGNVYIADTYNNVVRKAIRFDDIPVSFVFDDQSGVALDTLVTSNAITVSGLEGSVLIAITGGEYELNSSGLWSSLPGTVSNGDTVRVRQISSSGYGTTTGAILTIGSISGTFRVTTLVPPPAVVISSPGTGSTNNNRPLLTYTVSTGTVVVKVDDITVPKVSGDTLGPLADGSHTVRVEATDVGGNVGSATVTFTVDTIPPMIGINPVISPTKNPTQTVSGTRESGAMVTVTVDTSAVASPVSYGTPTTWSCTISNMVKKTTNTITATAKDTAGNTASVSKSIRMN